MSNYLLQNFPKENYMILRPFGMFGPYESESKIFPMLINAQIRKVILNLSPGTQLRDYFFVNDLVIFISTIIKNAKGRNYPNLINIGSNNFLSFIEYSELLKLEINNFDPNYWNWGSIKFREDDLNKFYSNSNLCFQYGFKLTPLNISFKETYLYYKNIF
jgi:nucleoside-diphosphate-sugar epimerase